jgi:hypothetical protein
MRYRIAFAVMSVALLLLVLEPASTLGQFKKKGGGFPGQGGGPGGFGGFGPRGGGGDPNTQFDFFAKGRPYFLVTDSPRLSGPLGQFLQEKGITSGQVTRDLWVAFNSQMTANMGGPGRFQGPGGFGGGGGFNGSGFGGQGGWPGPRGFGGQQGGNPIDTIYQMAEAEFRFRDRNGDGFLNMDEMPPDLKADLSRWDTSRDNLISLDEYKVYFATRVQNRRGQGNQQIDPITIIIEDEDLDARPVVYRAGKLPAKGLPDWFKELDTNKDGQVALYEWRKGGKDIDEFREWDRNDDGFITADEALYKQNLIMLASASSKSEDDESPALAMRPANGFGKKGFGGNKDSGGKGKGKGKGKGGGGGPQQFRGSE